MRVKYAFLTFFTGSFLALLVSIISFVATPFLLRWLGQEDYGIFRILADYFYYLAILELGLANALLPLLMDSLASNNRQETLKTLSIGFQEYAKLVFVIFLGAIAITLFFPLLLQVPDDKIASIRLGCAFISISVLATILTPLRSLAEAAQRGYLVNIGNFLRFLVVTGLGLFFAYSGRGVFGQLSVMALANLFVFVPLIVWAAVRFGRQIFTSVRKFQESTIKKRLWQLNWSTVYVNFCGQLSIFTDNIIAAFFIPPKQIVPYLLTLKLPILLQTYLATVGNSVWAPMAEIAKQKRDELVLIRMYEVSKLISILGTAVALAIVFLNHSFVTLWVGSTQFAGPTITLLGSLNAILIALIGFWTWCILGIGEIDKTKKTYTIATLVNVIVSIVLAYFYGFIGPIIGTFLSYVLVLSWRIPVLLKEIFGASYRQLFFAVSKPAVLGINLAIVFYLVGLHRLLLSWFTLILLTSFVSGIYLVISWFILLSSEERSLWLGRLRQLRGQPK